LGEQGNPFFLANIETNLRALLQKNVQQVSSLPYWFDNNCEQRFVLLGCSHLIDVDRDDVARAEHFFLLHTNLIAEKFERILSLLSASVVFYLPNIQKILHVFCETPIKYS